MPSTYLSSNQKEEYSKVSNPKMDTLLQSVRKLDNNRWFIVEDKARKGRKTFPVYMIYWESGIDHQLILSYHDFDADDIYDDGPCIGYLNIGATKLMVICFFEGLLKGLQAKRA
ncbi:MAG: hypothetical protein Q7S32_02495 [bacterium]|nr:hypothetical protein [bacterium]